VIIKKRNYAEKRFLFWCRKCCKDCRSKREFEFMQFQRVRGAILRCCKCGLLISRNIKFLDKQLEEEKKDD